MKITIESDRPASVTPEPDHADTWLVFGIRDAGEPVPLAAAPGAETLAYRNDRRQAGELQSGHHNEGPAGQDHLQGRLASHVMTCGHPGQQGGCRAKVACPCDGAAAPSQGRCPSPGDPRPYRGGRPAC